MATQQEIDALLAVPCGWCGAEPGRPCTVRYGKTVAVPSTLDGASHDARWRKALGRTAKVVGSSRLPLPEPEPVGAVLERPW